jgi:hypothetical protein
LTSLRWWISAEKNAFPLPTQQMPVIWLPLSMPARTSCTHPSHCQLSWVVNGQHLTTLALPARSNFRRCTGHQGMPIPISYIHKHGGYKPSFRSKMLLTSVDMAFYSIHTFQRPPPGSTNGECCLSPGSAARWAVPIGG